LRSADTELLEVSGIEYVGPLPAIARTTAFATGYRRRQKLAPAKRSLLTFATRRDRCGQGKGLEVQ
jgi:hypothetical protein